MFVSKKRAFVSEVVQEKTQSMVQPSKGLREGEWERILMSLP